jgi:multisubunit Na+/H+ antiporter MnhB subunit
MALTPAGGLLTAAAVHLGFQAVVSAVVYPALAESGADRWEVTHAAHTRRITPVVAPVYAGLGTACVWALVSGPRTPLVLLAVGGAAAAATSTAFVAAPTHRRLGREGPTRALLERLRTADRVRLAAAAVAGAAALAAVLTD